VRPAAGWLVDQIQQRRERLQAARRQRTGETPESQPSRPQAEKMSAAEWGFWFLLKQLPGR
jgi:hypothetical protein